MATPNQSIVGILAGILLIAVLALGGLAGFALSRPAPAQAQSGIAGLRQITVVGNGEVRVTPDMATVQIGVETTAPTTQEALDQNSAQARAIIDQLTQLGLEEKDLQTSGFNIYATYADDGRTVTGYTVSNSVSATIRDLAQAGALLDSVVAAGANRVYGISFGISDPKAAQAQARDAALADAQARAAQLATSSGGQIGAVLVISESIGASPVIPMPAMMDRAESMGGAAPIQAGEQLISAALQVTYELR